MKAGKVCRLSPGEEAAVLKKRIGEKRTTRLLQVREQERGLARKLCKNVQARKENERKALDREIKARLAKESQQELRKLESLYNSRVRQMGKGHRNAHKIVQDECKTKESRLLQEAEQKERAQARHDMAMKELSVNQQSERAKRDQLLKSKKKALDVEKERSRQVAARAYSSGQPLILNFEAQKGQRIQFDEADSYASSYYHLPHTVVERDPETSVSGHQAAQDWTESHKELSKHSANAKNEQDEKAWLRHKHALARVRLERDREDMMSQLMVLEKEDRAHRQRAIGGIPTNVFQPIHQRIEMVSEQQKDMEQTFERLLLRTNQAVEPLADSMTSSLTDESEPLGTENSLKSFKLSDSGRPMSSEPVPPGPASPPLVIGTDSSAQPGTMHSPAEKSSKRMQTDPMLVQFPHMKAEGLTRPTLSVSDTLSCAADLSTTEDSDEKKETKTAPKRASKPPVQPTQRVPNESMQRLMTMVKQQQAAWKERQEKLGRIPRLTAASAMVPSQNRMEPSQNRVEPGQNRMEPSQKGVERGQNRRELSRSRRVPDQHNVISSKGNPMSICSTEPSECDKSEDNQRESSSKVEEDISMYPIILQDSGSDMYNQESYRANLASMRASKVSVARRERTLSPPHLSAGNTGLSQDPLSITQYHTTLDSSSARAQSGSPDLFTKKNSFSGHHSPKSLSITPFNTTLENSVSTQPPNGSYNAPDLGHHLVEKTFSGNAGGQLVSLEGSERLSLDDHCSDPYSHSIQVGGSNGRLQGNLVDGALTGSSYSTPLHTDNTLSADVPPNTTSNNVYNESCRDRSGISFYGPPRIGQNFNSLYHRPTLPPLLAPCLDETSSTIVDQMAEELQCENSLLTHSSAVPVQQAASSSESFHLHYSSTSSGRPQPLQHPLQHPLQSCQSSTYSPEAKDLDELPGNVQGRTSVGLAVVDGPCHHSSNLSLSMQEEDMENAGLGSNRGSQSPLTSSGSSQGSPDLSHHADVLDHEKTPLLSVVPVTVENQHTSTGLQTSVDSSFLEHYTNGRSEQLKYIQTPPHQFSSSGQEQSISVTSASSFPSHGQVMKLKRSSQDKARVNTGMSMSTQLSSSTQGPHWSSMRDNVSLASYQTTGDQSRTTLSSDFSRLEFPAIALSYPSQTRTSAKVNFLHIPHLYPLENPEISLQSSMNHTEEKGSHEDELTNVSQLSLDSNHDENVVTTKEELMVEEDELESDHEISQNRHGLLEAPADSLQAAFLSKKAEFVKKSQNRMKNLKSNALQREQALQTRAQANSVVVYSKPSVSKAKFCEKEESRATKGVKFSESPMFYSATSMAYPEYDLITREKDKMKKREMKERNLKLYNRLDEVKQKKEEEERIKRYAENRKKAKDYHQRLRTKSKILKQGKKESSKSTRKAKHLF